MKHPGGRPLSANGILACELGITTARVRELGGAAKLRGLSESALSLLIRKHEYGNSRSMRVGGIKRRGFNHGRQDFLITPHIRMMAGFQELISDEDVAAVSVEGGI